MQFSRSRSLEETFAYLDGCEIERVSSQKYTGVFIAEKLSFEMQDYELPKNVKDETWLLFEK